MQCTVWRNPFNNYCVHVSTTCMLLRFIGGNIYFLFFVLFFHLLLMSQLVFAHDLEGGDMHQAMKVLRVPGFEEKVGIVTTDTLFMCSIRKLH